MTLAEVEGDDVYIFEPSECLKVLLDLICYEMHVGRLSPEMKGILEDHVAKCPSCRKDIHDFTQILTFALAPQDGRHMRLQ